MRNSALDNKDPWGINEVISTSSSHIQSVLSYSPWHPQGSPFILSMEFSKGDIYLLLRNGIVIRISSKKPHSSHFNMQTMHLMHESPHLIALPAKVVDLSCGLEHALVKGEDGRVYSWGSNTYGQLGITTNEHSNKTTSEPSLISQLSQWKICQIQANDYTSYCLTSDNSLFGFGNNEQGQIVYPGEPRIACPHKIASFNSNEPNIKVIVNKKGRKLFYSQIIQPEKSFKQSIEMNEKYQQSNEEHKLMTEVKQLRDQLSQLIQSKNTAKSNEHLIQLIEQLIIKFEEKMNKRPLEYKAIRTELEPGRSYDRQIDLFQSKKGLMLQELLVNDLAVFEGSAMLPSLNRPSMTSSSHLLAKHAWSLASLIEGASSTLQIQKTKYIETMHNDNQRHLHQLRKNKDYVGYIQLFNEVIDEVKFSSKQHCTSDSKAETDNIKEKCLNELHNFLLNTLEGATQSSLHMRHSMSLNDFNKRSSANMGKLSEKMSNLAISTSSSNVIGRKLLSIFNKNIALVHQTNYLTHFVLNELVGMVYNYTAMKDIKHHNPADYNEVLRNVEGLKQLYEHKNNAFIRNCIKQRILNSHHHFAVPDDEFDVNSELNSEDELN